MDSWIWNQVSLELIEVHIESSVKSERSRDGRHNLGNQTIEVGVGRPLNVEIPGQIYTLQIIQMDMNKKLPPTDVVDGFIVHHEGTIGMLQCGVSTQG